MSVVSLRAANLFWEICDGAAVMPTFSGTGQHLRAVRAAPTPRREQQRQQPGVLEPGRRHRTSKTSIIQHLKRVENATIDRSIDRSIAWRGGGLGVQQPPTSAKISKRWIPGGATRVPYPTLMGYQRTRIHVFGIQMTTFCVQMAPASPGPQYICLMIASWAEIRFLHSEPKTRARAELAIGPPFPPAKWRAREADVGQKINFCAKRILSSISFDIAVME
eukprot:gene12875-biopygen15537